MKRYHSNIFLLVGFYFLGFQFPLAGQINDKWNGSVTFNQKLTGPHIKFSEKKITIVITENRVTGIVTWDSETVAGNYVGATTCSGEGEGVLQRVDINEMSGEYAIDIKSPRFTCILSDNVGQRRTSEGTEGISISGKMPETNRNLLTGSTNTSVEIGAGMIGITSKSWSLYRGPLDAVLIVSPVDYNNWMPFATRDELRKGNVMDINLKVQKRNGGESPLKVSRFELKLNNTSTEKGTTLNFPLEPSPNQLPDLRLLPDKIAESIEADQSIGINSTDGKTGYFSIGSYDGGGWTTLTAVAVLDGGIRIEGTLLTPTGVREIPIPKRNGNSKIATKWLNENGNPAEMDDKEKKAPNPNIGDGLTAYEEYRGVISEGEFTRLKPADKELGVMIKNAEKELFAEGISWLENASGLKIIRFDETEIGTDRRLNKNFKTSHDYKQYVLKIENGSLGGDAVGENQPESIQQKVPQQSEQVVIDVNKIRTSYQSQAANVRAANMSMPYTEEEDLANTVAHELGHGIHIIHHGKSSAVQPRKAYANSNPPFHIYWINSNTEETARPYPAGVNDYLEDAGVDSCDASGDLNCIMAYTSNYNWAFRTSKTDGSLYYYKVPLLPVGKKLCTSKTGTGINAPSNRGVNNVNKYFGNAENGICLNQIKLRD